MKIKKGISIELEIESIASGGKGLARVEGFVIFVRGALPGDRVNALITKKKKGYAEARMLDLLSPSKDRIEAPCPYFGYCGGCQWQHVGYNRQLAYKEKLVIDAMGHIGNLGDTEVKDTIPSENRFEYRNKMEFSFSDRRWLLPDELGSESPADISFALGLHVPGTFHKVIDIDSCLLQQERGNLILREVKKYAMESSAPPYGLKSHIGFWRFLTLRRSFHSRTWMVNIITSEEKREVVEPLAERLCTRFDDIETVVNNITNRKASIAVGEREIVLKGEGIIHDHIGPYGFQISANSFFQTNSPGAEVLYQKALEYADLKGSELVLDLYSGTGTIPIYMSSHAGEVLGMEIVESSILDAEKNCRENSISNCRFVWGDIKDLLGQLEIRPDVIIIDPPRAGMHKNVLARVIEMGVNKIVYISCNPATLARDLAELAAVYDVKEIQPVDMFPHTHHIECVTKLVRK